ncbi:hypothetical protein RCL1_008050 [Eukaryota sp. TZLM3-RCL]
MSLKHISHYVLGDLVGRGANGSVYKAHDRQNNRIVAVKESPVLASNEVMSEIEVLKKLTSPHVVTYYDFIQTPENLYIVLEWCDSSVRAVMAKYGLFPESTAAHCIAQVLDGLIYLHDQAVIHRDIKGANILMNHEGKVKLADFGVSVLVDGTKRAESVVGTPFWMPPEVIEQSGACEQSDIWALGCTVVELIKGNPPYGHLAPMAALFRIVTEPSPPLPDDISPELHDFLCLCFKKDPRERPSAKELRGHKWLKDFPPMSENERVLPLNLNQPKAKPMSVNNVDDDVDDCDFGDVELSVATSHQSIRHIPYTNRYSRLSISAPPSSTQAMLATFAEDDMDDDIGDLRVTVENRESDERGEEDEDDWEVEIPKKVSEMSSNNPGFLASSLADTLQRQSRQNEFINFDGMSSSDSEEEISSPSLINVLDREGGSVSLLKKRSISLVQALVDATNPGSTVDDNQISSILSKMINLFSQNVNPDLPRTLVSHHGLVPLISLLSFRNSNNSSSSIVLNTWKLINQVSSTTPSLLKSFCLLGAIPALIHYSHPKIEPSIRLETAKFVKLVCSRDVSPLHMFVAADGLTALVSLLQPSESSSLDRDFTEMVSIAVLAISTLLAPSDSCSYIHDLVTSSVFLTPRFEYCRLLTTTSAPLILAQLLFSFSKRAFSNNDPKSNIVVANIIDIFDVFSHAGHAVVLRIANNDIIKNWLESVPYLEGPFQNKLLACIKLLSLDPDTLTQLQSANAIKVLVPLLDVDDSLSEEILRERHNQVLNALFNLCKYNPLRQADAAASGMAVHLVRFISSTNCSPALRHFAIPLLCDMAKCGRGVLSRIKDTGASDQFIRLLHDNVWGLQALDALSSWAQHLPQSIQGILLENISLILSVITRSNSAQNITSTLESVLKLCNASPSICRKLADAGLVNILLGLLKSSETALTLIILKLFTVIYREHRRPKELVSNGFYDAICSVILSEKAIVVQDVATKLKRSFDMNHFF